MDLIPKCTRGKSEHRWNENNIKVDEYLFLMARLWVSTIVNMPALKHVDLRQLEGFNSWNA